MIAKRLWLPGLLALCASVFAADAARPNLLVFLVDDMGWQDTSVPFWTERTPLNDKFVTPNMERLAERGMRFTQAYACCVCSPTRVSLMTGINAARHRVTNWTLHPDKTTDKKTEDLVLPVWNMAGMQPVPDIPRSVHATPLAQILHDHGYFTIHCGKAHFGGVGTPGADPRKLGFDVNIAGHAAGGPGSYQGLEDFGNAPKKAAHKIWGVPGLEKYHGQDIHLTEALTREALAALDTARATGKPFFLYMAHYAVHAPHPAGQTLLPEIPRPRLRRNRGEVRFDGRGHGQEPGRFYGLPRQERPDGKHRHPVYCRTTAG